MNEKIKFQKGSIYDIAPGGAYFGDETAKLILVMPEGKTYDDVEADLTGNSTIQILDVDSNPQRTKTGYTCLDELARKNNYVIGTEPVVGDTDAETSEVTYMNQDIVGTVMIATLKKADVRLELELAKAEIANLNETVDLLLIASLEG